jgi:hypothetical protein
MLKALLQRPLAKTFTEKTLLLLNREGAERLQRVCMFIAINFNYFVTAVINDLPCSL